MAIQRKTFFISDLHLDENDPVNMQVFLQLLKQCETGVDALYILGDLFEAWIGDDNRSAFYQEIIDALQKTTQKLPIYIAYGNRDFLIGKQFLKQTGCQLLADEEKITLYHTPILLMHGDTLCTEDKPYLKMRKICRNKLVQSLFLLLPLKIRKKLANKLRSKSAHYIQTKPKEIMDVTQQEVEQVMKKHGAQFLIHGHTHQPGIHPFSLNGTQMTRIVLGAWDGRGHVLLWQEDGSKELMYFASPA